MFSMSTFLIILFVLLLVVTIAAILTPDEKYKKRKKHRWWQDESNRVEKHNGKYYFSRDCYGPPMEGPMPGAKPVNMDSDDYFFDD